MKVYLNTQFLTNFFLNESDDDLYFEIKRFLRSAKSGAEIVIVDVENIDDAYANPAIKPFLRQIADKIHSYGGAILSDCVTPEFHDNSEAKIFFLDDEHDLPLEEFGCFITNSSKLEKADFLFQVEDIRINSTHKDWSVLEKIRHPCNALIITDNYLLSKERGFENLASILKSLMPKTLNESLNFDLTLIGYDAKKTRSIDLEFQKIKELVAAYNYRVNLTIIREDHHDRRIFTNYSKLESGKGFDLFEKGKISRNNETSLDFKPISHFGLHSSTELTVREELARCKTINRTDRMPDKFAGNRINRLLS